MAERTERDTRPRRRYECAQCFVQFTGPPVDIEPGKVVVCEACFRYIEDPATASGADETCGPCTRGDHEACIAASTDVCRCADREHDEEYL